MASSQAAASAPRLAWDPSPLYELLSKLLEGRPYRGVLQGFSMGILGALNLAQNSSQILKEGVRLCRAPREHETSYRIRL